MKSCFNPRCQNKVIYSVHLYLSVDGSHPPAISTPLCYLCEEHKSYATFEMLTPPEGWEAIQEGFKCAGLTPPTRKYSKIILEKVVADPNLN